MEITYLIKALELDLVSLFLEKHQFVLKANTFYLLHWDKNSVGLYESPKRYYPTAPIAAVPHRAGGGIFAYDFLIFDSDQVEVSTPRKGVFVKKGAVMFKKHFI